MLPAGSAMNVDAVDVVAAWASRGRAEVPGRSASAPTPSRRRRTWRPRRAATSDVCHGRLLSMAETVAGSTAGDGFAAAPQMLHDFNLEYDEQAPPPDQLRLSRISWNLRWRSPT